MMAQWLKMGPIEVWVCCYQSWVYVSLRILSSQLGVLLLLGSNPGHIV